MASSQRIECDEQRLHDDGDNNPERGRLLGLLVEIQQEIEAVEAALMPLPPEGDVVEQGGPMQRPKGIKCKGGNVNDGKMTHRKGREGRSNEDDTSEPSGPSFNLLDKGSAGTTSGQLHMKLMQDRLVSLRNQKKALQVVETNTIL